MFKNNSSRPRIKKNILVIMSIVAIIFVIIALALDGPEKIFQSILKTNPFWLLIAVAFFLGSWMAENMVLHLLIKEIANPHQSLKTTTGISMIGRLFDCLTPMSTGGQPVQIWQMSKQGIRIGKSTSILIIKFILFQFVITIFSIVVFIFSYVFLSEIKIAFRTMLTVGLIINIVVAILLLMTLMIPKILRNISFGLIKFLAKIKVINNRKFITDKINKELVVFYQISKSIIRHKRILLIVVGYTVLHCLLIHLVPFFVFLSLGNNFHYVWPSFLASVCVWLSTAFIPLPGASIGAEAAFYVFFSVVYSQSASIGLAMIIWRAITYYLPISLGLTFVLKQGRPSKIRKIHTTE